MGLKNNLITLYNNIYDDIYSIISIVGIIKQNTMIIFIYIYIWIFKHNYVYNSKVAIYIYDWDGSIYDNSLHL